MEKSIDGYSGFLFYDDNGMPLVAMHWQHRFNHMVGRYNDIYRVQMPNITPHVCRHTYCSNMAKSGMNPKTLQYLMGHSDISVTMKQGSLTAIVGPSGSGKSTLMKLCARFYDPDKGVILLGNKNIREIDPEKLMQRISMVFQDVYLFQDTIKNNIRFGKENATDNEIIEAAKKAQCHDFIIHLPQGYDTMIGEGGCTLSGGEKQRISIARAILKDCLLYTSPSPRD